MTILGFEKYQIAAGVALVLLLIGMSMFAFGWGVEEGVAWAGAGVFGLGIVGFGVAGYFAYQDYQATKQEAAKPLFDITESPPSYESVSPPVVQQ